ncbi:metallophosphoesterase family protein [Marinicella sp. W31]|uniref:metallophosphoesterase family protein n=1 Tax=Marinicella sp. W31 TaxID=3023713 RepID=UPI0037580333
MRHTLLLLILISFSAHAIHGIPDSDVDSFKFYLSADPQMGEAYSYHPEVRTLNYLLHRFVTGVNAETDKPDFVVFNGDLVHNVHPDSFANFRNLVRPISVPVVLVHGNHDGVYPDTQFLDAQQDLSGYRNYNYSFDYGRWHFVVLAAPEQYPTTAMKEETLAWLRADLAANQDRPTMLFMHYHILPVGLSQLEFYTYNPQSFKNELLDVITSPGNVKYVMSGHVHSGLKAANKTKLEYRGTNFFVAPTPVVARMFGEEYSDFEGAYGSNQYRRGYYTEVRVNGDDVELIGRKIDLAGNKALNAPFKPFKKSDDIRAFIYEGKLREDYIGSINFENGLQPCQVVSNPEFHDGGNAWQSALRYKTDDGQNFINRFTYGQNHMEINALWGGWSEEEHLENYQVFKYRNGLKLEADFEFQAFNNLSGGGYIRIPLYRDNGSLYKMIILHWGSNENEVKYLHQVWAYNMTGQRKGSEWINAMINNNDVYSYKLSGVNGASSLELDIDDVLDNFGVDKNEISRGVLAYGLWTRYNLNTTPYRKAMTVDKMNLSTCSNPYRAILSIYTRYGHTT